MKKKISIKKNIIKFDSKSLWYDITEILENSDSISFLTNLLTSIAVKRTGGRTPWTGAFIVLLIDCNICCTESGSRAR